MPLFDSMFADCQTTLDEVFADALEYRAGGQVLPVTGIVASHRLGMDVDRDVMSAWEDEMVELPTASLVYPSGDTFLPNGGHEIAKQLPDGTTEVFIVVDGPNGRPFEYLDTDHTRIAIFCKHIRTETA